MLNLTTNYGKNTGKGIWYILNTK